MTLLMKDLLSRDIGSLGTGALLAIVFGAVIFLALFLIAARLCHNLSVNTGTKSHSAVKIGLVALAPCVFMFVGMFHINIPYAVIVVGVVAASVAVLLWNLKSYGLFGGLLFSVVHIVAGVMAGLSVGGLIVAAVCLAVMAFFGFSSSGGGAAGGDVSAVRDLATGEVFHVTKGVNGSLYLTARDCILRTADGAGRYFDDNGNQYIAV